MLRLDLVHPVVSGNKFFKLYYFLEDALTSASKTIISFGGAYSNHLAATAFACHQLNIKCTGFVRGERPKELSHTLQLCIQHNMHLEFLDRATYKNIHEKKFTHALFDKIGDPVLIPEGGFDARGMRGAKLIRNYIQPGKFTYICCAIGTATTFAGLVDNNDDAIVMGFPVLKGLHDISSRIEKLSGSQKGTYTVIDDYHFGGYAKKNAVLIEFMNSFYAEHAIPLDFVYTGKMMYGVMDLVEKNYFREGSDILCIHTGGLQGNGSLPDGTLIF